MKKFMLMKMLALLTLLAFSAQLTLVNAHNSGVGVQRGNYFEYAVSISGPQAIDSHAYGVNNATATVTDVTGALVTYSLDAQYQNGTHRSVTASVNVATGESENSASVPIPWDLVAPNLGVGELTYPNSTSWANETVTINGRPSDHAIQTGLEAGGTENVTLDSYWDKATGVPVNVTEIDSATGQGVKMNMTYVLIATNAWTMTVPEFSPTGMVVIMTALGAVVGATALRRKIRLLPGTRLP